MPAYYTLGLLYFKGQGVKQDYQNSAKSYQEAFQSLKQVLAEQGHEAAVAVLKEL